MENENLFILLYSSFFLVFLSFIYEIEFLVYFKISLIITFYLYV